MFFTKKRQILSVLLGLFFAHSAIAIEQCQPSQASNSDLYLHSVDPLPMVMPSMLLCGMRPHLFIRQ